MKNRNTYVESFMELVNEYAYFFKEYEMLSWTQELGLDEFEDEDEDKYSIEELETKCEELQKQIKDTIQQLTERID